MDIGTPQALLVSGCTACICFLRGTGLRTEHSWVYLMVALRVQEEGVGVRSLGFFRDKAKVLEWRRIR